MDSRIAFILLLAGAWLSDVFVSRGDARRAKDQRSALARARDKTDRNSLRDNDLLNNNEHKRTLFASGVKSENETPNAFNEYDVPNRRDDRTTFFTLKRVLPNENPHYSKENHVFNKSQNKRTAIKAAIRKSIVSKHVSAYQAGPISKDKRQRLMVIENVDDFLSGGSRRNIPIYNFNQDNSGERKSGPAANKAEDLLMDEIQGSEKEANDVQNFDNANAEEVISSSMKEGDMRDIETPTMIRFNEMKGKYIPVFLENAVENSLSNQAATKTLTDQFKNISGLPEFGQKRTKNASLVETVAQSLVPRIKNIPGFKQLYEEAKEEQSLRKGLEELSSPKSGQPLSMFEKQMINSLDTSAAMPEQDNVVPDLVPSNTMPEQSGADLRELVHPSSQEEYYDQSIDPPEQLLDLIATGRLRHPIPTNLLNSMSGWNANKMFLPQNGLARFGQSDPIPLMATASRIGSDLKPVHNLVINQPFYPETNEISPETKNLYKHDPAVLGGNQIILDGSNIHNINDLESVGPAIFPGRIMHLKHHPKHVYFPTRHIFEHIDSPAIFHETRVHADRHHEQEQPVVSNVDQMVVPVIHEDEPEAHHYHHRHHHRHHHYFRHFRPHFDEDFYGDDQDEGDNIDNFVHQDQEGRNPRCKYNPCMNGGRCTAMTDRYICSCRTGFTGVNCEKHSNCFPNPCKHGVCSPDSEGFVCTCKEGWRGKTCDEPDRCSPNPCIHGGTCSETSVGIDCTCPSGYRGKYCELEAKCTPINPCKNNGVCQELSYSYQCLCKEGFYGHSCEGIVKTTMPPPTVPPKVAPPQVIPIPAHQQPPFTLEEFNSYGDKARDYPVPEIATEVVAADPTMSQGDCCENEEPPHIVLTEHPAVVIHTGTDDGKQKEDKGGKDNTNKTEPPDHMHDDRFTTHLVKMPGVKAGPVEDKEEKKKPQFSLEKPSPVPKEPETKKPVSTSSNAPGNHQRPSNGGGKHEIPSNSGGKYDTHINGDGKHEIPSKSVSKHEKPNAGEAKHATPSSKNGKYKMPVIKYPMHSSPVTVHEHQDSNGVYVHSDMKNFEDEIKSVSRPVTDDETVDLERQEEAKALSLSQRKEKTVSSHSNKFYVGSNNHVGANLHKKVGSSLNNNKIIKVNAGLHNSLNSPLHNKVDKTLQYKANSLPTQSSRHNAVVSHRPNAAAAEPDSNFYKLKVENEHYKTVDKSSNKLKSSSDLKGLRPNIRGPTINEAYLNVFPKILSAITQTYITKSSSMVQGKNRNHVLTARPTKKNWCPGFCVRMCDNWCAARNCCEPPPGKLRKASSTATSRKGNQNVCASCHDNADCTNNECVCKNGFIGDGYNCEVDPCLLCSDDAQCFNGKCQCNRGYYGDGLSCRRLLPNPCPSCHVNADCVDGDCFCRPGFYGTGFQCWPL